MKQIEATSKQLPFSGFTKQNFSWINHRVLNVRNGYKSNIQVTPIDFGMMPLVLHSTFSRTLIIKENAAGSRVYVGLKSNISQKSWIFTEQITNLKSFSQKGIFLHQYIYIIPHTKSIISQLYLKKSLFLCNLILLF